MQTGADREAIAAMLEMQAMDASSVRIISVAIPTLVQVQILAAETKIGVMNAAQVQTVTVVLRSQTR